MRVQKLPPEYSKQADKYLSGLDKKTEQRLKDSIEKYLTEILFHTEHWQNISGCVREITEYYLNG